MSNVLTELGPTSSPEAVARHALDLTRAQVSAIAALSRYVARALDVTSQVQEYRHFFCWDWDIVQTYVESHSKPSLFAPALRYALSVEASGNRKVVLLDGARREAARYLVDLGTRSHARREEATRGQVAAAEHSQSESTNLEVELAQNNGPAAPFDFTASYLTATRVRDFLASSTEDASQALGEDAARKLEASMALPSSPYRLFLRELRMERQGRNRNDADARNLHCVHEINRGHVADGVRAHLVTGTKAVEDLSPADAIDPFQYFVLCALEKNVPEPADRMAELHRWNAQLSEYCAFLYETDSQLEMDLQGRGEISGTASRVYRQLQRLNRQLGNASLLDALSRAVRRAEVELSSELRNLKAEIPSAIQATRDVTYFAKLLTETFAKLLTVPAADLGLLGLTWSQATKLGAATRSTLRETDTRGDVVALDTYEDFYCVHWDTQMGIDSFINAVNSTTSAIGARAKSLLVLSADRGAMRCDLAGRITLTDLPNTPLDSMCLLRVYTTAGDFLYDPPPASLERDGRVAVMSRLRDASIVAQMYEATYKRFVPWSLFGGELVCRASEAVGGRNGSAS